MSVRVLRPGLFSTIQDLGRTNCQHLGIPGSGAMDAFSLRVANLLVGNEPGEAGLEVTLLGPELEFCTDTLIAISGADLNPSLNGASLEMWSSIRIAKGDVLSFGKLLHGCRAYLAFRGGIDVPRVLGSKSTYVSGLLGGLDGRRLESGDELRLGPPGQIPGPRRLASAYRPVYSGPFIIRLVPGPQDDFFPEEDLAVFADFPYQVTGESDRMGYRLRGARLTHARNPEIVSDAVVAGAVQVPGDGNPIIMMADRQTTGGYPKIGVAITPDLDYVGQAKPGDKLRFEMISLDRAHRLYRQYMETFDRIRYQLAGA
jgi:antagonist of KipI